MIADSNIIEALQLRPSTGFSMLMKRYQEPVYWHTRRLLVDHADAEDATQETFVRIYRSLAQIAQVKSLKAWIFTIATREALRIIDGRRHDTVSLDGAEAFKLMADEWVDLGRKAEVKFQQAILSLPRKQQLVFNLRYYNEMAYSEIATIVGTTAVSARMNYHLAKNKIVKYLKTND